MNSPNERVPHARRGTADATIGLEQRRASATRRTTPLVAAVLVLCGWSSVRAEPAEREATRTTAEATPPLASATQTQTAPADKISARRRALAVTAAVVPGVALHGAGAWVLGDKKSARRLATAELVGLGLAVVGGLPLLGTYGSPKVVFPAVPLTVLGAGIFLGSWVGDVWVAAGGHAGTAPATAALAFEAGAGWLDDPYHGGRGVLTSRVSWRGRHIGAAALLRLDHRAELAEGGFDVAWHLAHLLRGRRAGDRLALRLGAYARREPADGVRAAWHEGELLGRLELAHLSPGLAGLFFESSAGLGLAVTEYPTGAHDVDGLLLARFGAGAYLGRGRGELSLAYVHRRDDLVGGLAAGRAAGFFGYLSAQLELRVTSQLDLLTSAEFGNATLITLGLRYRAPWGAAP